MKVNKNYLFAYIVFTVSMLIGCPYQKNIIEKENSIIDFSTEANLQNMLTKNNGPILLYLYMNNCHWCEKMKPIVQDIANNEIFKNIAFCCANGITINAPNILKNIPKKYLNKNYTLKGYPSIVFLDNGQCISIQSGGLEQKKLEVMIQQLFPYAMYQNSCKKNCKH